MKPCFPAFLALIMHFKLALLMRRNTSHPSTSRCKQRRINFEEYVTRFLVQRASAVASSTDVDDLLAAELENDPFAHMYSTDAGAGPGGRSLLCPSEDLPAKLLAQRDALMSEIRASHEAKTPSGSPAATITDAELLRALNVAGEPRFHQLRQLMRRANDAKQSLTASEWGTWPRGSWASVCDDRLLGPFPSYEAAIAEVKRIPRSCFGAFSWQVGVPPEALIL